jgi:DNA helicase-2/ATP-dependent DNA helicase PcrA
MLSHSVLAREQGYPSIPPIYGQFNDPWLKKDDPHIKFLADHLEPACAAFEAKRYGEMFGCFGIGAPKIRKHADKVAWLDTMTALIDLRTTGTIGEIIDFVATQPHMCLPEAVEDAERRLADAGSEPTEGESQRVTRLRKLRAVPYTELIALDRFIDGHTPFATKHGVKGAEFENVLVIVGRGMEQIQFRPDARVDRGWPASRQVRIFREQPQPVLWGMFPTEGPPGPTVHASAQSERDGAAHDLVWCR